MSGQWTHLVVHPYMPACVINIYYIWSKCTVKKKAIINIWYTFSFIYLSSFLQHAYNCSHESRWHKWDKLDYNFCFWVRCCQVYVDCCGFCSAGQGCCSWNESWNAPVHIPAVSEEFLTGKDRKRKLDFNTLQTNIPCHIYTPNGYPNKATQYSPLWARHTQAPDQCSIWSVVPH